MQITACNLSSDLPFYICKKLNFSQAKSRKKAGCRLSEQRSDMRWLALEKICSLSGTDIA